MNWLRLFPYGAMLLIAVVPYHEWGTTPGTFPAVDAHRAVFIACLGLCVLAWFLRVIGLSGAKANAAVGFISAAILANFLNPYIPIIVIVTALVLGLIDRKNPFWIYNLSFAMIGLVQLYGAATPLMSYYFGNRIVVEVAFIDERLPKAADITLSVTPSIIHIVLDAYGSDGPIREIYDHNPQGFFNELRSRGFTVVEDVVSPYSQTLPTMAAVMSGSPIDLDDTRENALQLRKNLAFTIRHGPVPSILEQAGYVFARTESGYNFLDYDDAEVLSNNFRHLTPFESYMLFKFGDFLGPIHNDMLTASLEPGSLSDLPSPYYYYQHLLAPHLPFTINADGSYRKTVWRGFSDGGHRKLRYEILFSDYTEGYREKIRYTERALIDQIDGFPEGPKIIIIHGDHGPGAYYDQDSAERTCMRERLPTFLAIYSDEPKVIERLKARDPGPFSTVNVYRAVLSGISDHDLAFLPPEPRFLEWNKPWEQTVVSLEDLSNTCVHE